MNLGFVILYVHDMAKSKAFYTDVLGLGVVEEISGPSFVTLRPTGGSLLALQSRADSIFPPGLEDAAGSMEISFEVDDVDATWNHWKQAGVEIVADPVDMSFGRYFMARDPEGHYLSVYRFTPRTPPAM